MKIEVNALSLSTSKVSRPHEIILPSCATSAQISHMEDLRTAWRPMLQGGDVSFELHGSHVTNWAILEREVLLRKFLISSVDVPDIKSVKRTIWDMTTQPWKAIAHAAWGISNVNSQDKLKNGVWRASALARPGYAVRANAVFWPRGFGHVIENSVKEARKAQDNVIFAIEPADGQTPADYFEFMARLEERGLDVVQDIDLGKFALAIVANELPGSALTILNEIMNDPKRSKKIGRLTLGQYASGDQAHALPWEGVVDLEQATYLAGVAKQRNWLPEEFLLCVEPSPFDYPILLRDEGKAFIGRLVQSWNAGLGAFTQ